MTNTTDYINHKIDFLYELISYHNRQIEERVNSIERWTSKYKEIDTVGFGVGLHPDEERERKQEVKSIKNTISHIKNEISYHNEMIETHIQTIGWFCEILNNI